MPRRTEKHRQPRRFQPHSRYTPGLPWYTRAAHESLHSRPTGDNVCEGRHVDRTWRGFKVHMCTRKSVSCLVLTLLVRDHFLCKFDLGHQVAAVPGPTRQADGHEGTMLWGLKDECPTRGLGCLYGAGRWLSEG